MKQKFKQDKGVAGLTILLSLVVMLFIIGLIVMIFTLMGGELQTATYDTTTASIVNETITGLNLTVGDDLSVLSGAYRDVTCTISSVKNVTSSLALTKATNYTLNGTGGCNLRSMVGSAYVGSNVNVDYSYVYEADNTATESINGTIHGIKSVIDWFDIFIVIGAMVVLILLTVIIITAIRSSGMVAGAGSQQGANSVGTA